MYFENIVNLKFKNIHKQCPHDYVKDEILWFVPVQIQARPGDLTESSDEGETEGHPALGNVNLTSQESNIGEEETTETPVAEVEAGQPDQPENHEKEEEK